MPDLYTQLAAHPASVTLVFKQWEVVYAALRLAQSHLNAAPELQSEVAITLDEMMNQLKLQATTLA